VYSVVNRTSVQLYLASGAVVIEKLNCIETSRNSFPIIFWGIYYYAKCYGGVGKWLLGKNEGAGGREKMHKNGLKCLKIVFIWALNSINMHTMVFLWYS